jgi:hypothetical protein
VAAIGGAIKAADSSGTEARQFYLLMGLFAGESQTRAGMEMIVLQDK